MTVARGVGGCSRLASRKRGPLPRSTRETRPTASAVAREVKGTPTATIELANPAQVRFIDDVEVGYPAAHRYPLTVRVAFEVPDAAAATVFEELGPA